MIKDALLLQKRELEKKLNETYINRKKDIKKFENDLIKVIIGPRRAGKSFFAIHTLKEFGTFGYVNFDDEVLASATDYNEIITVLNDIYNNPKNFLFDEIQNLENWELFVNRLQRQGYNITITGSNSHLLSKELASHLTGRHIPITIFPFSFSEVLSFEKKELITSEIKNKFLNYIETGGYPELIVKKSEPYEYLSNLVNSTIYKDIVKRFKIRYVQAIEDLATYLLTNITKEFSYNTLVNVCKCKSSHTIEKYLHYLEETFLLYTVKRFSYKLKNQISTNKKIFCIDNGIITAKSFRTSKDLGKLLENVVSIFLKKKEVEQKINFYYWQNIQKEEVDFIIKKGTKIVQLIQVCFNIEQQKTKKREIKALLKASEKLFCNNLLILTYDYQAKEEHKWYGINKKITFLPAWKWFLNSSTNNFKNIE